MKKATFCAVILTAFLFFGIQYTGWGQTVAAWEPNSLPGGTGNYGPSPWAVTTSDANVTVGGLTRGNGVQTTGSGAARAWGGNGFTSSTAAASITANTFVTFTIQANPNYKVSLSSFDLNYRRSSTGPANALLQYQVGNGAFVDISTLSFPISTSSGSSITQVSFSGITDLQNVVSGTTITIRIVPYGGTNSAGTWYVFDINTNPTAPDLVVGGSVQLLNINAPTIQAYNVSFPNVGSTNISAAWTNGNGEKRVVIISPSPGISAPVNNSDPVANTIYSGSAQQVVYNGSGSSVTVTNLALTTTYWFQVFEYNGSGVNTKYCIASGANNPMSQATVFVATAPQVTAPSVSSITNNTAVLGGTIVSDGGSPMIERGTVWSINSPVTINDNKLPEGSTATGAFSQLRSSLPAGTELFYAAYAINGIGAALSPESSFNTLADEPSGQATNFGSSMPLYSAITVTWADNDGTQPASAFLVLANTTGTFTAPVDGVPQVNDTILGDGSGKVNVLHGIQSYTWIGLNPSTTYYFAIYPYTNSGSAIDYKTAITAPVSSATTTAIPVNIYTWSGANNGVWTTSGNWTPARTSPAATDILQFSDGTIKTITGIPSQTIGQFLVSGNTKVTLQSSGPVTLTIAGSAGTDLDVAAGCELNLGGANAVSISVASGATGSITGNMTFSSGAHRLVSGTAGGISFNSNSVFTAATGFTGSAFGTAAPLNAVIFANGSTYACQAGSNPFGANAPGSVVTFLPGSLFKAIAGISPSFSGRTYGNFELDATGATLSPSGTSAVSIQNLTITNGTLNFNMTGSPGHSVKGNIFVAPGATLNFLPSTAGTVSFDGTSGQSISGGGTITFGVNSTLIISDPANISLNSSATINGTLALSSGLLILTTGNLSMGPTAIITGAPSASAMIVATNPGQLRKEFPVSGGSFTFPVGNNSGTPEYLPVTLSFTSGVFGAGNWVGVNLVNAPYPVSPLAGSYIDRYWNISSGGITNYTCDAVFSYISPDDVVGNENQISCVLMTATPVVYNLANTILHQLTATNLTSFGSFTGTQIDRTLNLTMFLEGLYSGGGTMSKARDASGDKFPGNTADQVIVELHSSAAGNYSTVVYSSGLVNLNTSGHINLQVPFVQSGSYYITIRHRNSIETVSAVPVSFSGYTLTYDFSDAASKAYGNNLKMTADGKYVVFVGDVNQDGIVDAADMILLDNDASNFLTGYVATDINGDGFVNLADLLILDNNAGSFVSSRTP